MMTIASGAVSRTWAYQSSGRGSRVSSPGMGNPRTENGARRTVLDPDPAAVRLHGEPREGEAETPAASRGAQLASGSLNERIEDLRLHRVGDAAAGVRNAELRVGRRRGDRDDDGTGGGRVTKGVVDQIDEHTPDQVFV